MADFADINLQTFNILGKLSIFWCIDLHRELNNELNPQFEVNQINSIIV